MRRIFYAAAAVCALAGPVAAAAGFSFSSHSDDGVSVISNVNDDGGNFLVKSEKLNLAASWSGAFDFAADGKSLQRLDGRMEIKSEGRRAVFSGDGTKIDTRYFAGKDEKTLDAAAKKDVGELLLTFVRVSGFKADERVEALLKSGGPTTVMSEIKAIPNGYAQARYIDALAGQATLSAAQIDDLSGVIRTLDGDYAKRRAIEALMMGQKLIPASRASLLKAAEGISSDHELCLLVEAAASGELTPGAVDSALSLLLRISGDHDFKVGAEALLANEALSNADAARIVETAGAHMESDHDLWLVVGTAADRAAKDDRVAKAAVGALSKIGSDHDRMAAVMTVADALPKGSAQWLSLIEAAGAIGSDHDAAMALQSVADQMPREAETLAAYRKAAAAIASEHDRENALLAVD